MLQPAMIARELVRALKRDSAQLVYRVVAPNRFVMRVPPGFLERWRPLLPRLEREMAGHLVEQMQRLDLSAAGDELELKFESDPGLPADGVRVETSFRAPRARPARLVSLSGWEPGRAWPLVQGETLIGRGAGQVALPENQREVSRRHARVLAAGEPPAVTYRIEDLGSATGTFLNQRPVTQAPLNHGDLIAVGAVTFLFELGRGA